jgi:uroporphyrinogen decarboxylase
VAKETSKALLQKTIDLRKAAGIPVVANTCVFNMKHFGKTYIHCLVDPREYVEVELMCYKTFGYDGVWTIAPMEAVGEALGSKLRFFEDDVPAIAEPILKEPRDLMKLIKEDRDIKPHHRIRFLCEVVSELKKGVGNETMVMANAHSVFRLAGMLRGINNLYMDLIMNPNFVKDLQNFCLPKCVDFALELVEAGADMIVVTNPIANANCISREMYASQVHPYTKKLYQAIKQTPAKLAFHPCGQWDDRFDLLIEEAPDVLWVDKVDLGWVKDKYGEKVCIMGNVKTTETMLQGTSQQVEQEALECLRKGSKNGGFILSADCALPRDVPAENLQTLIDTARKYTG